MASPAAVAEPAWLAEQRERAAEQADGLELPSWKGRPGWEFTDLGDDFDLAGFGAPAASSLDAPAARVLELPEGARELLTVGAASGEGLELSGGAVALPLATAAATHGDVVQRALGSVVALEGGDRFVAENAAGWSSGTLVYVPRGVTLEAPVVLTQVLGGEGVHRRTLIVLEDGAEAEVWEQALSADDESEGLLNHVVELVVGPNARLRYIAGQELNERTWIFGSQRAEVERDGALDWVVLGFGSGRGRVQMETKLAGRGSEARVTGAYASHARQHLDFDTRQEHAAPDTVSDLAFRGVLDGRSTSVWRGMIRVDPGAQRTDAFQESRNLLLSKRAHADAIPGLEIEANDVRCTHAAAIAQVDREQLYYLRSRGLPQDSATRLVIDGFMQELVERFPQGAAHDALSAALERRLESILGT